MSKKEKKVYHSHNKKRKKGTPDDSPRVTLLGKIDLVGSHAYFMPNTGEPDVWVSLPNLATALHGDQVRVAVIKGKRRTEGKVIEILQRSKTQFVGIVEIGKEFSFLVPSDTKHMPYDIVIPHNMLQRAKAGEKVVVEIIDWGSVRQKPTGKVIQILGKAGENDTEMHAILAEFGLPYHFSDEVEREAESIPTEITEKEIKQRRDFRDVFTITIDPLDAKDFDDAISLVHLENATLQVGIHIADVSHYVKENSILDKEAKQRATSIYLVDRTVPMLPEKLSNGLCSLRPQEEKLCYSAVFTIEETSGKVINKWFGRTIIKSDRRYTYEEAQLIIDTETGDYADQMLTLHKLAQTLRKERISKGAILFERSEPKFILGPQGKPLGITFSEDSTSHQLVEEFMLLANRSVAEIIGKPHKKGETPKTFVYRIHERPNPEKLQNFAQFVSRFGYQFKPKSDKDVPMALNSVLQNLQGKNEKELIENLALKAMSRAQYTTQNVGHYGLAFDFYTHFTSPIRRYPDVLVHRLLDRYLNGEKSVDQQTYEELCTHASNQEQLAVNAERASIKYKTIEFMQDKIGVDFPGVVSGVNEWGFYVEIFPTKIEGMIPLRTMGDDFYYFDEKNYCIIGKRFHKKYTLGDKVNVRVVSANMIKKQLTFELLDS